MEIYQVSETRNNYWSNQSIEKFARLEYRNKSEVFHNELFQGCTGCTWFRPTNHISRQRSLILANIRIDKPSIFVISWMSAVSPSCLRRIYLSRPFFFLIKVEQVDAFPALHIRQHRFFSLHHKISLFLANILFSNVILVLIIIYYIN